MPLRFFLFGPSQFFGTERRRQDVAANAKVIAFPVAAVRVKHEAAVADRNVDPTAKAEFVRRRSITADRVNVGVVGRHSARDATIEDVDGAPNRLASEQEHRRAVKHLDAIGSDRIDGNGMVGGGIGNVDRADAVDKDPDPLTLKAAKDWPRCAGAEGRSGNAWEPGQSLAQLGTHVADQFAAAERGRAREQVEIAHERRGDDDRLLGILVDMVFSFGRGRWLRGSRNNTDGAGREQQGAHLHCHLRKMEPAPWSCGDTLYHERCRLISIQSIVSDERLVPGKQD